MRKPSTGGAPAKPGTAGARPGGSAGAAKPPAVAPAAARGQVEIEPLPSFKDTPAGERQGLFIRKLRLCSQQMDFSETDKARDKEIKRLNLLEIMDYINTTKGVFNESTFEEITHMISSNLFRGLAPNSSVSSASSTSSAKTDSPTARLAISSALISALVSAHLLTLRLLTSSSPHLLTS